MKFFHVRCKVCGEYIFDSAEVVAFRPGPTGLRRYDLDGQQPWGGIFCVCHKCIEAISAGIKGS